MIKMNFNQSERRLRLTVAVLLISVITVLPLGFSQTVKAQTPSKASARAESKGGQVEGIKVHGHWTIEVRNPDGTLVTRREFENALTPFGAVSLAGIFVRALIPGQWRITLEGSGPGGTADSPCITDTGSPRTCEIYEPASQLPPLTYEVYKTLTFAPWSGYGQPDGLDPGDTPNAVLNATVIARRNGKIDRVFTDLSRNPVNANPYAFFQFRPFTSTTISPVEAKTGQIIQVTVTFSFTSPSAPSTPQ